MRIAIFQKAQLSTENAIFQAVARAGMQAVRFGDDDLPYQGYIIIDELQANLNVVEFLKQENRLGRPILGIGAGAKILLETGLVPGLEDDMVGIGFRSVNYDSYVYVQPSKDFQLNAFTRLLSKESIWHLPTLNTPGAFAVPPGLLYEMQIQGLTIFNYCDHEGNPTPQIAAVSNKAGNVMAMAPHPEYAVAADIIFQSMRDYINAGLVEQVIPLHYYPRH